MTFRRTLLLAVSAGVLRVVTDSASADAPEWKVTTIATSDDTPLARDVRRNMAGGYFDRGANKTFISFSGENMVPHVAAYDHATGKWSKPVSVKMQPPSNDVHDYSHIFPLGDGRVGLTTSLHNRKLYFAKSEKPHDIEGDWKVREVGSNLGATYPMPMTGSDETIYIMYRRTKSPSDYRPINWVRSTDNGDTWSAPQATIDYNNSRTDHLNEIYQGGMSYEADHPSDSLGEGYHGSWTIAGGGPTRHKHNDFHKNIYYAFFHFADGHWYAADGTDLGLTIDDAEAEAHAKVFDSGPLETGGKKPAKHTGYISEALLAADGKPVVVFEDLMSGSITTARWRGGSWDITTPKAFKNILGLCDAARIDGRIWLLRREGNGGRIVEMRDDGLWTDVARFMPPLNADANHFIDNARPDVLILSIGDYAGGSVYSVGRPGP